MTKMRIFFDVFVLGTLFCSSDALAELPCKSFETLPAAVLAPELEEISGIALSRTNSQYFWSHTDSGGRPELYLLNEQGVIRRTYPIDGAKNVDWEDIAVGPCERGSRESCIYIADIGDNLFKRDDKKIYIVKEPPLHGEFDDKIESLKIWKEIDIKYPETDKKEDKYINPDAESIMVSPNADIYIISKQSKGGAQNLYRVSCGKNKRLEYISSYSFASNIGVFVPIYNAVTAADFAPDGKRFSVRTYAAIYEYDLEEYPDIAEAFRHPKRIFTSHELQGESLAYMADGRSIATASEKPPIGSAFPHLQLHACRHESEPDQTQTQTAQGTDSDHAMHIEAVLHRRGQRQKADHSKFRKNDALIVRK